MPDTTTPNIAKGETAVQIDTFNQWLRSRPEYAKLIQSFGQDPANVHLSGDQQTKVVRLAQQLGAKVDEGNMEVDPSGNFRNIGHKLRNTLIVAGIAGATLATMGAAGVFSGAAGAAGAGAGGAGTLAGATAGLSPYIASGTIGMSALPGVSAATLAGAGLAGLSPLASTATAPLAGTLPTGLAPSAAGTSALADAAGPVTTGSRFADITNAAKKVGNLLSPGNGPGTPGVDENGNPVNAPTSAATAANAQALTNNRFLAAPINQRGPAADAESLRNMYRAGLMTGTPTVSSLYPGGPDITSLHPSTGSRDFAQAMQDQLTKRMAAGQPLTLSGLPEPTDEEKAATEAAKNQAGIGTGLNSTLTRANNAVNTAGNVINTGVRYAQLGKNIWDTAKGIFS